MKQIWELRDIKEIRLYLRRLHNALKGDGWTDEELAVKAQDQKIRNSRMF